MSNNDILDFLNEIAPTTTPEEKVIGSGNNFDDAQAGVPQMGPPLITVTIPEDGSTSEFENGKLVYYAKGGRRFFGYYSDMKMVREGNKITLTGTLIED